MSCMSKLLLPLGLCVVSVEVFAQTAWVPLTAKHREVHYLVEPGGQKKITAEREGVFVRSANGSSMFRVNRVSGGQEQPDSGRATFTDATTGKVFEISYKQRVATVRQLLKLPLQPRSLDPKTFTGEKYVSGLRCVGRKVVCEDAHTGNKSPCGNSWYSPDYDLTVKTEVEESLPNGAKIVTGWERYDIAIGAEPEPDLLRIPPGFTVRSDLGRPVVQCATCGQ